MKNGDRSGSKRKSVRATHWRDPSSPLQSSMNEDECRLGKTSGQAHVEAISGIAESNTSFGSSVLIKSTMAAKPSDQPSEVTNIELADAVIRHLFHIHLRREANEADIDYQRPFLIEAKHSVETLYQAILQTDEYKNLTSEHMSEIEEVTIVFDHCKFRIPSTSNLAFNLRSKLGYEPWVLPHFLELCKPGCHVVDVGANWGIYSIPAARRVGSSGQVWSFEANTYNARRLLAGRDLNGLRNLRMIPSAVGNQIGYAYMPASEATDSGVVSFVSQDRADDNVSTGTNLVTTLTLDSALAGLDRLELLKIDVDGSEALLLQGAEQIISRLRPDIFMEYCPILIRSVSGCEPEDVLLRLLNLNYRISLLPQCGQKEPLFGTQQAIIDKVNLHCREPLTHVDLFMTAKP